MMSVRKRNTKISWPEIEDSQLPFALLSRRSAVCLITEAQPTFKHRKINLELRKVGNFSKSSEYLLENSKFESSAAALQLYTQQNSQLSKPSLINIETLIIVLGVNFQSEKETL